MKNEQRLTVEGFNVNKQYHTQRLTLQPSAPFLTDKVVAFVRNNQAFFAPTEPARGQTYYTKTFQRRMLMREQVSARERSALRFWLLPRGNEYAGEIIGVCGLSNIIYANFRSAFVSYKLDSGHTGQGYMAEALTELARIAFEELGLHRLESNIMPGNQPSLRLVQGLGFQQEGLARSYLNIGGVWQDHLHMVRLNE